MSTTTDAGPNHSDYGQEAAAGANVRGIPPHAETGASTDSSLEVAAPRRGVLKNTLIIGVVALLVFAGATKGWSVYRFGQTHVGTDDAYVTGDLVNISPIVSGTLAKLTVAEGDSVKKGQLIATLDDKGPRASLLQAEAALEAAQRQIPEAERNLEFTALSTNANIQHAQSAISAQTAKTSGAEQQVALTTNTVRNQVLQAESQVKQAQAQASQADAQAAQADAQVTTAQIGVQALEHAVQTARSAARAADAGIIAARANADRAKKDETRYAELLKSEAVTQQQYDSAHSSAESTAAQLTAAQEQSEEAKSALQQASSNVEQAQSQLLAAAKQAVAAHKQADASWQQVNVAIAGLGVAKSATAQTGIQVSNVANNAHLGGQAQADLLTAQAGREQIAVRGKQIDILRAQVQQARAAVRNAKVTVDDTSIYAPCDGVVVKKAANVGTALSPGETIVTITQGKRVWVNANFKETQLTNVRAGQKVEVEVDSFPGKIFEATVDSVNRATGAATALLPPDNATGNFTKVVQRIAVKIEFTPTNRGGNYATAADVDALHQGMSVGATISTGSGDK